MNNSPTGLPTPVGPPFELPLLTPRQKLRLLIGLVADCLARALDRLPEEGTIDQEYVGRQLHIAYGKLLDALVLDLDPPDGQNWPEVRYRLALSGSTPPRDPFLPFDVEGPYLKRR